MVAPLFGGCCTLVPLSFVAASRSICLQFDSVKVRVRVKFRARVRVRFRVMVMIRDIVCS